MGAEWRRWRRFELGIEDERGGRGRRGSAVLLLGNLLRDVMVLGWGAADGASCVLGAEVEFVACVPMSAGGSIKGTEFDAEDPLDAIGLVDVDGSGFVCGIIIFGPVEVAEVKGSGFASRDGFEADVSIDVSRPSFAAFEEGGEVCCDCCSSCSLGKGS